MLANVEDFFIARASWSRIEEIYYCIVPVHWFIALQEINLWDWLFCSVTIGTFANNIGITFIVSGLGLLLLFRFAIVSFAVPRCIVVVDCLLTSWKCMSFRLTFIWCSRSVIVYAIWPLLSGTRKLLVWCYFRCLLRSDWQLSLPHRNPLHWYVFRSCKFTLIIDNTLIEELANV